MDIQAICEALKATTVAENQADTTNYLEETSKLIGFSQILLDLAINEQIEYAIRQAAAIYLKNLIKQRWVIENENNEVPLSDQDKVPLRQKIILAIMQSPDGIRNQLCLCILYIMRSDYPTNWPELIDNIVALMNTSDGRQLQGCLLIIHKLCKIYEYKTHKEKIPLIDATKVLLPLLYQRFALLIDDNSDVSYALQKIILKIFYCLIQFSFNLKMISFKEFGEWLHLFLSIIMKKIPEEIFDQKNEAEDSIYWKCKKWAMKIINRVFERYCSKDQLDKNYIQFAEYYTKEFLVLVFNCIVENVLEVYAQKKFVPNHILFLAVNHFADAIAHSKIWLIIKPYFKEILRSIIFPMLMHTAEDEELWETNVEEYLHLLFNNIDGINRPSMAASKLLLVMSRRIGVLITTLEFTFAHLTPESSPHDVDTALNIISILAPTLQKNKKYKKDVEKLVQTHIIPRFTHPVRFVRARACFAAKSNSKAIYSTQKILQQVIDSLIQRLIAIDEELPVKVEAATAISSFLSNQNNVQLVKPHIREILIEVLKLVSRTQVDDLQLVIDKLIDYFEDDVIPVAYDVTVELVAIFNRLMEIETNYDNQDFSDDCTLTVMGILSTIERILCLVEDHKEIVSKVEPVVRNCIVSIFEKFCLNYLEEGLLLTQTLIEVHISPEMWEIYYLIYNCFSDKGTLFFCDFMPVLHSYLTVGTENFLAVPERIRWLLEMCEKTLLDDDCGDYSQENACKLFEVFILQCIGRVDNYIPSILQLVLNLLQTKKRNDLRIQLIIVFIAAFYYNYELFIQLLPQLKPQITIEWLFQEILDLYKHLKGIHNRKMFLYFMCIVLTFNYDNVPSIIKNHPNFIIELFIKQFDDLQKCIKTSAENKDSDDEFSESDSDSENKMIGELKDSDDDVDQSTLDYLENCQQKNITKELSKNDNIEDFFENDYDSDDSGETGDTDYSEDFKDYDEIELDSYETLIDADEGGLNVFVLFKSVLDKLKNSNPQFYMSLICGLDKQKMDDLQKLITICEQQENLDYSKRVALAGGYTFDTTAPVPTTFNFS